MDRDRNCGSLVDEPCNTSARFSVELRHVTWVLLIATCLWGILGYTSMPQRKDPEFQVRIAVALTPWPGASAEKVEQLVSKRIEESAAGNARVKKLESISRTGLSVVYFELEETVKETGKEFDDIKLRLDAIRDLPQGAGHISFLKDFGDTAALMLTVASPRMPEVEVRLRAQAIRREIEAARAKSSGPRMTLVVGFHEVMSADAIRPSADLLKAYLAETDSARDIQILMGKGFVGLDVSSNLDEAAMLASIQKFVRERTQSADFHPDMWAPVVIQDPAQTEARLQGAAGQKYSCRELDDFTDQIEKALKRLSLKFRASRGRVCWTSASTRCTRRLDWLPTGYRPASFRMF
jgi:hypothetical protein